VEDKIVEINSLQEFLELAKEEEMNEEEKVLREYIRKKISKIMFENQRQEFELRKIIRKLLREGDISDVHPHRSTAINTLEDVLKKAIPTLRTDYKRLTTDKSQRDSFRAHILKAMKDAVAPSMNNAKYGAGGTLLSEPSNLEAEEEPETPETPEETEEEGGEDLDAELEALEEAEIDIVDKSEDEKKLNVEPDEEPDEKSEFGAGLEGMDETGRNMAYTTFRKISQYILDAFDMLANLKDKEVFIDYLLTNTKLYFDKFESELQKTVDEPDSPEA
tara:strand:- start:6003 stop:6830 length:828 start_codon:yes stop_codon:yes gene_type:complete